MLSPLLGTAGLRAWSPLAVTVTEASTALWVVVVGCVSVLIALERRRVAGSGGVPASLVVFLGGVVPYLFDPIRTVVNHAAVAAVAAVAGVVTMEIVDALVRFEL